MLPASHNHLHRLSRCPPGFRKPAFALMVALVLLGFIMLLLMSLATYTNVDLATASLRSSETLARKNALFALQEALGKLQQYAGPDQRITATADLQPVARATRTDPASAVSLGGSNTAATLTAVDNYWQTNGRQRHWTGVWKDPNPARENHDADNPADSLPVPELLGWLVSGGNTTPPERINAPLTPSAIASPQNPVSGTGGPYRILVGGGTVAIGEAADLDRIVLAPAVDIQNKDAAKTGSYAWWIGDEGLKAHVNITDPYAGEPTTDLRKRLLSAQRPAPEAIDAALKPTAEGGATNPSSAVVSYAQLPLLAPENAPFATALKENYHTLTANSLGVLSDTRHGGLRHDLSMLLGQPTLAAFNSALAAVYGLNASSDEPAKKSILLTRKDSGETPPAPTVYAQFPTRFYGAASSQRDYSRLLDYCGTWGQLYSYYNMGKPVTEGGVMSSGTVAQARTYTDTQMGIAPVIVQAKMFFGLDVEAADPTQPEGGPITLKIRPLVVLANPYSTALTGSWWVRMDLSGLQLRYPEDPDLVDPNAPDPEHFKESGADPDKIVKLFHSSGSNADLAIRRRMLLSIPDFTFEPGRAYVFTLDRDAADSGNKNVPPPTLQMVNDLDETTVFSLPTGEKARADKGYVTLYAEEVQLTAELIGGDTSPYAMSEEAIDAQLAHFVYGKPSSKSNIEFFTVYPVLADGQSRDGGGVWLTVDDSFSFDRDPQQAPFLQVNYRARVIFYTGRSGYNDHPGEWARTYLRDGSATNVNNAFRYDVLLAADSTSQTHWGLANRGNPSAPTTHRPRLTHRRRLPSCTKSHAPTLHSIRSGSYNTLTTPASLNPAKGGTPTLPGRAGTLPSPTLCKTIT